MNKEFLTDLFQNKNVVMFFTSIVFMSGILAYFSHKPVIAAFIISCLFSVLLILKIFSWRKVIFFILVFYCGFFLTNYKISISDDLFPITPTNSVFTGRIISIPNSVSDGRYKFFMNIEKVDNKKIKGKTFVYLKVPSENFQKLNIGQRIKLKGNLRAPFHSTNPSQFDYSSYLKNFGVFTVLYSTDEKIGISNEKLSAKWKFLQSLNDTRNRIIKIHSKYLKSPNLEILGGIVFGDDAVAPPSYIKNSFANSGLLHILAASGMNVAFIFAFWFYILRFLKVPYKFCIFSGMFVIILYTLMTGLGASVVRASLMILLVLLGKMIDRDAHSVSLLSFVAVLMLIYNPAYINDVSFQMSFLVTLGLVTTFQIFSQKLTKIPGFIKDPILIPLVAQFWIAPVQMFYFNTFSLYSIFANITSVNILSVISFGGFVSSIINTVPCELSKFICQVFDFILNYFLSAIVWISNFFAHLPNCVIQTIHPNIMCVVAYYAILLLITGLIKFEKFKLALVTSCVSLLLIIGVFTFRFESDKLEIIAFDVQNADSFLIKTPHNKYFFVDTGKAPYNSGNSQAKIIMLKYLKDRGIKDIEGIIVTHFDNDHSGGTVDFIENTNVKTLYLNSKSRKTQTAKNIFKTAEKIHQKYKIAKNNKIIYSEPDLTIKTYRATINSSNEASIITLLSYKDFDMLFMGDAGIEAFNNVKKDIPRNVEIFKVGHHGGPGVVNKSMVEYLKPKVSIISTGINYFGHPNKGTLDILRDTQILRTDIENSVKLESNGTVTKIFSYDNLRKKYLFKNIIKNIK